MHHRIIGIPFKPPMRISPPHPHVKGIVQKQICQQGTTDAALRRALLTLRDAALLILRWRFQPPFDVEHDPRVFCVFLHRPHQQIMVNVVEETLDVQVDDPVRFPASLPSLPHRFQCRLPRAIPIGIRMEERVHRRFQSRLHHHLGDPI